MFEKVKQMIAEQLSADENSITEETSFKDDLGADSLDLFQLVMAMEDEFKVEIPSEDLEKLNTVGDVMKYLKDKQISRYRELALIALLLLITMGLLQINRYREMQASGQRAELAIHSVERIAKELDVPAEEVFLNATEFSGNPIIFAEGKYYRVLFINDTSCNLEPIELLGTEPEFIRE